MEKVKLKHFFKKNIVNYFLYINFFSIFLLVKKYSNYLEPFEDEMTSLLSGVSFLRNLDFNGSPLINGSYSPYLTSGPIASVGSGIGWIFTKDIVISRISNFYFLALLIYSLFFLTGIFNKKSRFFNLNFILISLTLVPWWFGSLYSLGEMFSSALFVLSILSINTHKNLAFFIMSFSVIFGKFIQILLVIPFIFMYLFNAKKIKAVNIFSFLLPIFVYFTLVSFKTENFDIIEYFNSYFDIIYNHQSSGLKVERIPSLDSIIAQLNKSEFIQWSQITKIRVFITPIIFTFLLYINRKLFDTLFTSSYAVIFSILVPYFWFVFFSQTKWIRYSQHFLFLIIFLSLFILFSELNQPNYTTIILVFNLSLFLSSEFFLILFLLTLFAINKPILFRNILLIVLILNSLNLLIESQNLLNYDLDFENCKSSITSIDCIEDYLPYSVFK